MRSWTIVFPAAEQAALVEEETPDPGPGQVTLEAICSLISTGTELICYFGSPDPDTHWAEYAKYPHHPGYSLVGRVVKVGEGVTEFKESDRVTTAANHRQFATVPAEGWTTLIPDAVSDEEAAWSSLAVITQTGVRMAEHIMGERAVIIGLGPLGQLVTQYLRLLGLKEIMAVDPVRRRLDTALAHGATVAFCGSVADAKEFVLEHTEQQLADAVYDVTGHYSVLPKALPLARDHGKLILLGDSPHPSKQCLTYDVLSRQVRIIGTRSCWLPPQYSYWTPRRQTELFFTYLQRGQMRVADLITHRFKPTEAAEVYRTLAEKRTETLGVLFDWR